MFFQRSAEINLEFDSLIIVLLVIVIVFFAIALLVALATKVNNFNHELEYLNREIAPKMRDGNTGSVRRDAFGYPFCRSAADKGNSDEKQIEKILNAFTAIVVVRIF